MSQVTATSNCKFTGRTFVAALASGALAIGALHSAPPAQATCASFFGIGNNADCTSTLTSIAIAIGPAAKAHAEGLFGSAFSIGSGADAETGLGVFDVAFAAGDGAGASAQGSFELAASLGRGQASAYGVNQLGYIGPNIALNISAGNTGLPYVVAQGFGNVAVNLFGNASGTYTEFVQAFGVANMATNFGGNDNTVKAGVFLPTSTPAIASMAFNAFGNGNTVQAVPGPLATAGSIGQNGATVTKAGPGFNINGIVVGGAAAVPGSKPATPAAAAGPAASRAVGSSKRTKTPSAAAAARPAKQP